MAFKAMKCPSCGADITLDDEREFGYCTYSGSQIYIREHFNGHVTHEYKGEAPQVHVTNQYFYGDQVEKLNNPKSNIVIEKPSSKKMGLGNYPRNHRNSWIVQQRRETIQLCRSLSGFYYCYSFSSVNAEIKVRRV